MFHAGCHVGNVEVFEHIPFKLIRSYVDDHTFAKWSMKRWIGASDIDNPKTFNEKLQWLKLHERRKEYVRYVDKYNVREYVRDKIGGKYLNDLYGVYDSVDEIDFESLPDSFVLKATHASGTNILVESKHEVDFDELKCEMKKWLDLDYFKLGREWPYKDVNRKIICEKMLVDESGKIPADFKVFCFHGEPKYIQVDLDRFSNHERAFYDANWVKQPFTCAYIRSNDEVDPPSCLKEMLEASEKLSKEMVFCRLDFYSVPELIFGEITLYPGNGMERFIPENYDLELGKLIKL